MAEKQQATASSVKISKNARTAGSKTQKFLCECGKEIKMIKTLNDNHKIRMIGRCEGCGQTGRSPKYMKLYKEPVVIERILS
jgi:predicted SprT family Zn-dependent metalloprotease